MLERTIKKLLNANEPTLLGILTETRPSNNDTLVDKLVNLVQQCRRHKTVSAFVELDLFESNGLPKSEFDSIQVFVKNYNEISTEQLNHLKK